MTDRPELKTWRLLIACETALARAADAASEERLEPLVRHQILEASRSLGGALATLEEHLDGPFQRATVLVLELQDLDALVAVLTGAIQRVPVEAAAVLDRLSGLRDEFVTRSLEIRTALNIPVD